MDVLYNSLLRVHALKQSALHCKIARSQALRQGLSLPSHRGPELDQLLVRVTETLDADAPRSE